MDQYSYVTVMYNNIYYVHIIIYIIHISILHNCIYTPTQQIIILARELLELI